MISSPMKQRHPLISVIMPTYNQSSFLQGSINSILKQSYTHWELIIIDDGSTDDTAAIVHQFLSDERIKYTKLPYNTGLGNALNAGLERCSGELIAYLPSDDLYYQHHLSSIVDTLNANPDCIAVYAGMLYNNTDGAFGNMSETTLEEMEDYLQLVQVAHLRNNERWAESHELITDDLNLMFWDKLKQQGRFCATNKISCEWVSHPDQRSKRILLPFLGNINLYKYHYRVEGAMNFKPRFGPHVNESKLYIRTTYPVQVAQSPLKILIVGELAYNADRICALEEMGHSLYALWTYTPGPLNSIGPLPFGNIQALSPHNWLEEIRAIQPDIIYACLNTSAVPIVFDVVSQQLDIPIVWQFKEGPSYARQMGIWDRLLYIYRNSQGHIFINEETRDWFSQYLDLSVPVLIMDGDLPKKEYFEGAKPPLLSDSDGEIHTVVCGRPMGISPHLVGQLNDHKIHLHYYGDTPDYMSHWFEKVKEAAPQRMHVHKQCYPLDWVPVLSQYDAGWLHVFDSSNDNHIERANWDDLNYPARISTMAAAGLPMIQKNNSNHLVATQNLTRKLDIGLFFNTAEDLQHQLHDRAHMKKLRKQLDENRHVFTFDFHARKLSDFFRQVIHAHQLIPV